MSQRKTMAPSGSITSMRIVTVDHYMHQPVPDLDPCYSEYRGSVVLKVPVIRIFGTDIDGTKSCMHVHGVFPYLYIPFDELSTVDSDRFTYQVSASLDKALNISLGQAASEDEHVFKIVHVKGVPFYGFHSKEHQFLKIYLYNPHFVRRAANLFQNGAILNKVYQPHESHVPYVLQFMIDYNLYGMSFLHVPSEMVRFRKSPNEIISDGDSRPYVTRVDRTSISQQEIDINAAFILNRLDINTAATQTDHENPGIASIWKDEQVRRMRRPDANYPVLEIPAPEHRPHARPTESEHFYRNAIANKLSQADDDADETLGNLTILNATNNTSRNQSKFNLRQVLNNSVYPSECSQSSGTLLNASLVMDHQQKVCTSANQRAAGVSQKSMCLDDTLVDEDIVNSLSQKRVNLADVTLNEDEFELLHIMEQLEANESAVNFESDSILATLSQPDNLVSSGGGRSQFGNDTKALDSNQSIGQNADFFDSDDELFNDFSMCLDTEEAEVKHGLVPSDMIIPQLDGADDPSKGAKLVSTPRKSTRNRYSELNVTVVQSPKRGSLDQIIDMLKDKNEVTCEPIPKRPRRRPPLARKSNGVIDLTLSDEEEMGSQRQPSNDISFMACRMKISTKTNPTPKRNELKTLSISSDSPPVAAAPSVAPTPAPDNSTLTNGAPTNVPVVLDVDKQFADIILHAPRVKLTKMSLSSPAAVPDPPIEPKPVEAEPTCRYDFRSRAPRKPVTVDVETSTKPTDSRPAKKKRPTLDELYDSVNCDVARRHDMFYNFFPEPGPSHINFYEHMDLSAYYARKPGQDPPLPSKETQPKKEPSAKRSTPFKVAAVDEDAPCIIKTLLRAPTFDEVLDGMPDYNIPYCMQQEPFYGNSEDASTRKEISTSTVLTIPTKSHKEIGDFVSSVVPRRGIVSQRKQIFTKLMGKNPSPAHIQTLLKHEDEIIITAIQTAPFKHEAELWLSRNAAVTAPLQNGPMSIDVDSPVKVRRETAKVAADGQDEDAMETDITMVCSSPDSVQSLNPLEEDVIELSPNGMDVSKHPFKRTGRSVFNRDIKRILRSESHCQSPNMFGSASSGSRKSTPSELDVICLDNEDEDRGLQHSALFASRMNNAAKVRAAANAARGNVSVNESYGSTGSVADYSFGISGASLENTFGFKMDLENFQSANAHAEFNYLTIMSLEIHVRTRGALKPDPQYDEIICIFYNVQNNCPASDAAPVPDNIIGVIINEDASQQSGRLVKTVQAHAVVQVVASERELILALVQLIGKWDPDIFAGYEIEMASWGYVLQRGQTLNLNLPSMMSRIPKQIFRDTPADEPAEFGGYTQFEVKLCGRIFLDVWRLMRPEIALTSYTFESVMFHIMHRRCPLHGHRELTRMWGAATANKGSESSARWIVMEYYFERVKGNLELLNQLDLIGRTCEMAKLFGIQFFEVLSRGSQFRVESMMLRIAKPKNIIPVSPSVQQRAHMRAPEYLPLILEPLSRFYTDSLIVLDFQSLYPSMIIAYNYCFSTCVGRVEHLGQSQPFEFGASQLRISPKLLRRLIARDLVTFSPCGAVFVKSTVREGVLPRMLKEILDTRLMVKQSMKLHRDDPVLQRVLHSRQLGLKLMANVTYGYTAANFSGRMPCVEVGDSVVSKGRETLERAIKMVAANTTWRSRVIYGDTDSLFVLVPGRTREDAFKIGAEIAEAVTQDNPHPVKLKLEKIYQPSILQTKKRYVGYMYETSDQAKPVYEAKGIETVRRDGCPAVAKMLEKTLKILFETRDVSSVKAYICRQFTKILSGKANVQDFIFAKEFRGLNGYKPGACVPSLELTRKWLLQDPRSEPRRGERVPYLVVNGPPGVTLIRLVRCPHEFLADPGLKINSIYYITKVIVPPLNRCLLLIGADAAQWFAELPRKLINVPATLSTRPAPQTLSTLSKGHPQAHNAKKSTISQYFSTSSCPTECGAQIQNNSMCAKCVAAPHWSALILSEKMSKLDRKRTQVLRLCASCCGRAVDISCRSLDCPVLYVCNSVNRQYEEMAYLRQVLVEHF